MSGVSAGAPVMSAHWEDKAPGEVQGERSERAPAPTAPFPREEVLLCLPGQDPDPEPATSLGGPSGKCKHGSSCSKRIRKSKTTTAEH